MNLLPPELIVNVASNLGNKDFYNLLLTSRFIHIMMIHLFFQIAVNMKISLSKFPKKKSDPSKTIFIKNFLQNKNLNQEGQIQSPKKNIVNFV